MRASTCSTKLAIHPKSEQTLPSTLGRLIHTVKHWLTAALCSNRSFVRQLVALALAPASFLPTSAAAPRTTIFLKPQLDSLDPLKQAPSRLRLAALTALRSIATRHGARAVLRALPGYGIPGPLLARLEEVRPRLDSDLPRKKRRLDVDEADESPSDEDDESPVARAGRCVAKCEDCWDLLAGKAVAKRAKVEDGEEEDPVHGSEGWELLRALLDVWEEEGSRGELAS